MQQDPFIILSFTTFKDRANCLAPVLGSIAGQIVKPNEIRCYTELQIYDFPENIQKLLKQVGVQLFPANAEEKGYKKHLPILKDTWGKNVIIIIIDDDWKYPSTLIKDLLAAHRENPNCIISARGRKIIPGRNYSAWPFNKGTMAKPFETMVHTGSGTLYKPSFFNASIFDSDYKILAPTADDLWITIQAIIAKTPVLTLSGKSHAGCGSVAVPKESKLYMINIRTNTSQWNKLVKYAAEKGINVNERILQPSL